MASQIMVAIVVAVVLQVLITGTAAGRPYCNAGSNDCDFLTDGKGVFGICEEVTGKYVCIEAFTEDVERNYNPPIVAPTNQGTPTVCRTLDASTTPRELCVNVLKENDGIYTIDSRNYTVSEATPTMQKLSKSYECTGTGRRKFLVCPVKATYVA